MGAPRRFAIPNDCVSCTLRRSCDFCNLPQPLMTEFNAMGHLTLYPANATLPMEGQIPRSVYIACSGRSKLSVEARDGKTIILKIAGERQVLGLSAVVSRGPVADYGYDHRALPDQVRRTRQLPASDRTRQPRRARMRSHARPRGHELVRRCLRAAARPQFDGEARTSAAFLGLGRETVTRLLSDMKRKDLIRLEGATLVIPNRIASQAIAPLEFPPPGGRSGLLLRPFFSSQLSVLSEKRWDQWLGTGKNDG